MPLAKLWPQTETPNTDNIRSVGIINEILTSNVAQFISLKHKRAEYSLLIDYIILKKD